MSLLQVEGLTKRFAGLTAVALATPFTSAVPTALPVIGAAAVTVAIAPMWTMRPSPRSWSPTSRRTSGCRKTSGSV